MQLLIAMLLIFLLGFFLDFIEIIFVVVPLTAPVLLLSGVSPVWLGVLIALNLQTSFMTPPFGFSLFYLRGVAPRSVTTSDIYRGVVPFIGLQLVVLLLTALFPILTEWLPNVLYGVRTIACARRAGRREKKTRPHGLSSVAIERAIERGRQGDVR